MTTSGVVNQTQINAAQLIESAVSKCGVPVSVISGEQLTRARRDLFLLLTALTNRGLNLWCQKRYNKPLQAGLDRVTLSNEVVDVLSASVRQGTYNAATSVVPASNQATYDAGSAVQVYGASVAVSLSDSYVVLLESSSDGVNWTYAGQAQQTNVVPGTDSKWIGVDADVYVVARYWRVTVTPSSAATTNFLTAATFPTLATELPMSAMNRDTYTSLPNKLTLSTNATLQYFFDKRTPNPILWVWPTTSIDGLQLVLWIQRQIQDVGDLTNTLDIPARWHNALIYSLAQEIYPELPANLVAQGRYPDLKERAEYWTGLAEAGETDGSQTRFTFGLRGYTR